MRILSAVLAVLAAAALAFAPAEAKENLPGDAKLRIGVKHRPDDCARRSKPGDKLSMHYTVRLICAEIEYTRHSAACFTGHIVHRWQQV